MTDVNAVFPSQDTAIPVLGPAKIPSPLPYCRFVTDEAKARIELTSEDLDDIASPCFAQFEIAGPRGKIYFDASKAKAAIVTCGGLCPGINDVIRAIVMEAHHNYGIAATLGIRFGLQGFIPAYGHPAVELTPAGVTDIHQFGGTMLGSSRGPQAPADIVDALERLNVSMLFIIGGDGTMRASRKIQEEITARRGKISVIGVPKTIDNDISFVTRSFGFDTAVEKATESIRCAHTEAKGVLNGVGLVKVMGRESGFIAAQATLALKEVNYVLVPEYPFELYGEHGLLPSLEKRLARRRHAVIVAAEGAGQHLLASSGRKDASGNPVLGDVAGLLTQEIQDYFKTRNLPLTLKYIDPSYIIRSVPANANDRVYCGFLGQHAVHAAMAGKTGMVVSKLFGRYVHLPFDLVTRKRKRLNIASDYWRAVLESTGQQGVTPLPGDEAVHDAACADETT
ncbi:ATP-dependent 6-phosphofructokinase [Desulfolutivibrio sulfoxidireducens]|uniref:ATP-dependent 6-phosphofructokinase n=1 Tax=Desulfolutivibrio sulfoxidireducens TaxID=2773299 RepID=UPI00159DB982|nr:ATP-dependent 6-phosphofructokinase [Desulfolutivibrio sulfoxidireducens]QLA17304.1 ATP-dependent 6-phosphofructokinase [Desulfolutivibrio sulfoxidireducens]QLA20869.1 ATP-dependent 6-phosphofructokinase [Desulfolutivibrio sulfoxidireducens]